MSDFRRFKWTFPGCNNGVSQLQIVPRVSLILAFDSTGKVYFSLLQANSNSQVMKLFFTYLIQKLDEDHRGWRRSHVILLDNAPYHRSQEMLDFFEEWNVPLCFTGPHSYDACPCETWFAHFKADDINPRHVPTSKK